MSRSIDHIVLPVHALEAANRTMTEIGFTLTPRADHPWGTANQLVQFDKVFLEYLEIADENLFPTDLAPSAFSFGHFNRDWLNDLGEGGSMLVLTSNGAEADRRTFEQHGLTVHDPFRFERSAKLADGTERRVAFSLTFVTDAALPRIAFFTCEQHYPENFWKPEFQAHQNGAVDLAGVVLVADEPSDHHEMLSALIGERDIRSTSFGIDIAAGRHMVSVLTPTGYRELYGETYDRLDGAEATIAAIRIRVPDLAAIRDRLGSAGSVEERRSMLVVPASRCHGCALVFEQA
ncbi:MAG: VOC family protein [Pseudomonadota bacterium]